MMTTKQAADELGVTPRRIQAMVKAGRLRSAGKFGRALAFRMADLDAARDRKKGRPRKQSA